MTKPVKCMIINLMTPVNANSTHTRRHILETAFGEIFRNGFRATSLSDILEKTGLTKGAFYYHFKNKTELGYTIIDEIVEPFLFNLWLRPLEDCRDPLLCLKETLDASVTDETYLTCGCPFTNLVVEMSPVDEGFRTRLERIFRRGVDTMEHLYYRRHRRRPERDQELPEPVHPGTVP